MAWLQIHHHSETLGMPVPMEVLLPQSFSRKLPTLYLLHDMGDGHTSWLRKTSLESYVEDLSIAVVMPAGHLGYYTDMFYGKAYFTFITEELPVLCESMLPLSQTREDRFIAGNGIGGYGALKAGLSATPMFSNAAAFSSPIDVMGIADRMDDENALDVFGKKEELKGSANDLYAAADSLLQFNQALPEIYLSCDLSDTFFNENESFHHYLSSLGVPLTFERCQCGDNGWKRWDRSLKQFITWLSFSKPQIARKGIEYDLD